MEHGKMKKIFAAFKNFLNEEDGPTAVEYGVMLALIIAIVFVAASFLGVSTSSLWANSLSKILAA